jgi:hypothetical protein
MRHCISRALFILAAGIFMFPLEAHAQDIQMLPPTQSGSGGCTFGNNAILSLSDPGTTANHSAINCNDKVKADPATGDVATTGSLSGADYCIAGVGCSKAPVPKNFSCPPGNTITGFDINGAPVCASGLPSCPDGQSIIYSGGVPVCTSPATGTPVVAKQSGPIIGYAAFDNWVVQGLANVGITPSSDPSDYWAHINECSTMGGTVDPTSVIFAPVTGQDCQMLLCMGLFGPGVMLYAPGGSCPAGSGSPSCAGYGGQPVVNLSCFY